MRFVSLLSVLAVSCVAGGYEVDPPSEKNDSVPVQAHWPPTSLCAGLPTCGIVEVRPACKGPGDDAPCTGGYAGACLTACCRFGLPDYECSPTHIQGQSCTVTADCAADSGLCCIDGVCVSAHCSEGL